MHVIVSYQVFCHDMQPMPLSELDFRDPKKAQRSRLLWNAIWENVRGQFEEWFSGTPTLRDLRVDTQCKDAARPSAMAFDPKAKYFKDDYEPYTVILSQALLDFEQSKAHVATGNPVGRPAKTQLSRAFDAADIEAILLSQGTYRKNQISHRLEMQWKEDSQMAVYHQRNQNFFSLADNSSLLTKKGVEGVHNFETFCGKAKIPEGVRMMTGISEGWRKSLENRIYVHPSMT